MRFFTFVLAAIVAALPTKAFIAFSGDHCDGDQGFNVACDGACHTFAGRHSFVAGSGNHCVAFFTQENCIGEEFDFTNQGTQCTNVNTGTPVNSFRCFAGSGCS